MAKVDDVQEALERGGLTFLKRCRNGTNTGDQLRFEAGEIVNVLDSGKISVKGKNIETVQATLAQHNLQEESRASPAASSLPPPRGRKRRASRGRGPEKQAPRQRGARGRAGRGPPPPSRTAGRRRRRGRRGAHPGPSRRCPAGATARRRTARAWRRPARTGSPRRPASAAACARSRPRGAQPSPLSVPAAALRLRAPGGA